MGLLAGSLATAAPEEKTPEQAPRPILGPEPAPPTTPPRPLPTKTEVLDRTVQVRFDSNVTPGLPWVFRPEQNEVRVRIGEVVTVHYSVTNQAARATTGQASYNVSPPTVGAYFNKINCFCFTEQRMAPGEKRDMAVVFYVDPELVKDREHDRLDAITLSYTFYPLRDQPAPVADAANTPSGRL